MGSVVADDALVEGVMTDKRDFILSMFVMLSGVVFILSLIAA